MAGEKQKLIEIVFLPPYAPGVPLGARNVHDDLERIQLAHLSSSNGTVWQVAEPTTEAANRLKALKSKPPPAILSLDRD